MPHCRTGDTLPPINNGHTAMHSIEQAGIETVFALANQYILSKVWTRHLDRYLLLIWMLSEELYRGQSYVELEISRVNKSMNSQYYMKIRDNLRESTTDLRTRRSEFKILLGGRRVYDDLWRILWV